MLKGIVPAANLRRIGVLIPFSLISLIGALIAVAK